MDMYVGGQRGAEPERSEPTKKAAKVGKISILHSVAAKESQGLDQSLIQAMLKSVQKEAHSYEPASIEEALLCLKNDEEWLEPFCQELKSCWADVQKNAGFF